MTMAALSWTLPADDTVEGTWGITSLNLITQRAKVEIDATLTADGSGAYRGFDTTCVSDHAQDPAKTEGEAVPFAATGDATLLVNQITGRDSLRRLTLDGTPLTPKGAELLREAINESTDITMAEILEITADQTAAQPE